MVNIYNSKRKLNELFEKALKFVGDDIVDNTVEVPESLIYLLLDQIQTQNVIIDETKKIVVSHSQRLDIIVDSQSQKIDTILKKLEKYKNPPNKKEEKELKEWSFEVDWKTIKEYS